MARVELDNGKPGWAAGLVVLTYGAASAEVDGNVRVSQNGNVLLTEQRLDGEWRALSRVRVKQAGKVKVLALPADTGLSRSAKGAAIRPRKARS